MSDLEPRKRRKKELAPRRVPQVVVPVAIAEARDFVRAAVSGTGLAHPITALLAGWEFFQPLVRFTAVDDAHTLIEIEVVGSAASETLLYPQRRAEIDRFFVAIDDELARRERWRPRLPAAPTTNPPSIDG